jgi:hypothetical protein
VLYALRHPETLLGLVLGFAVGIPLRAAAQQWVMTPRRRLHALGSPGRRRRAWNAYLDPFGLVAAILSGDGWGPRPSGTGARGAGSPAPLVVALVVHGGLALAGFAALVASGVPRDLLGFIPVASVLHGSTPFLGAGRPIALGFAVVNLGCGLLALVPIPPLEFGVLLWSRLPRSPGARRTAFHLLEEHWGIAAVLVLVLLPLGGGLPPLLHLIDAAGNAILSAVG